MDYTQSAVALAQQLIGCELIVDDTDGRRGGFITETEAYTRDDEASHSFRGPTSRNAAMFMEPGTIYIYQIYGLHHCLNIVCGNKDGQAVLIRALQPMMGLEIMKKNRGDAPERILTNGPANVFKALGLNPSINKMPINKSPLSIQPSVLATEVLSGPRIGITKNVQQPWRFYLKS